MLKNYRIFLAILLFAILINCLKADDDDDPEEPTGETPEENGAEEQEDPAKGQENEEEGAGNEEKEKEGEGENQEGPELNNGNEDEDQIDKIGNNDIEEKPDEDENTDVEGNIPGKDKKKPNNLPGKESKEAKRNNSKKNKKDEKKNEQEKRNGTTKIGTDNGIGPNKKTENTPTTNQITGQRQGNEQSNTNIPYSPTVYPNGAPGQPQQQPSTNIINPSPVYPQPNPVYPSQSDIANPINPPINPPIYPQYPPISPQVNPQQQQQPSSPYGTNSLLDNDIDDDPFGFGISLAQQQQYSSYSQYQQNQNIPIQYNPPNNNIGGFGNNKQQQHVAGQTNVPYDQISHSPMIVRGSDYNSIDNANNNYGYQRMPSIGRGRRSDDNQQQQQPVLSTVCFKPSPGTQDYSIWEDNMKIIINSNPQYQSISSFSNPMDQNNGGIPEICTMLKQNIETNGFQQARLIRTKRNIGKLI